MLAFAVADYSGQAWLQSFNDSATTIMGMPANQLNQYKVGSNLYLIWFIKFNDFVGE